MLYEAESAGGGARREVRGVRWLRRTTHPVAHGARREDADHSRESCTVRARLLAQEVACADVRRGAPCARRPLRDTFNYGVILVYVPAVSTA